MAYYWSMEKMKVAIIGSGVVGSATGRSIAGFCEVTFNDINHEVLKQLHFDGMIVGDNTPLVVEQSDIVFICVNTPTFKDGEQDVSQIYSVLPEIARGIENSNGLKTIILRSTVIPTAIPEILLSLKSIIPTKEYQKDWNFFYNPEFLVAENALETMRYPDRIVVGAEEESNWYHIDELYSYFDCEILKTGLMEAGMIKYGSNCFLATKISYFNDLGRISRNLGLNVKEIEYGIALDKRIGSYGTKSGKPYGGACFPKDVKTFCKNFKPQIIQKADDINEVV